MCKRTHRTVTTVLVFAIVCVAGCQPVQETPPPDVVTSKSGIQMVQVPSGSFRMGSATGESDEQPVHVVKIRPFLMDQFEVTHEMFALAELPNPSKWQDNARKPVEQIRWRDAKQYCNERSLAEELTPCYDESVLGWPCDFSANGYRLPTEAEWEYACRAGSSGEYDFGDASKLPQYAVIALNSGSQTSPVGSKRPNRWGLYDMYGNVSEWCHDVYSADYYGSSPDADPTGPDPTGPDPTGLGATGLGATSDDVKRVIRGGSWKSSPSMARATFRQGQRTGDSDACFFTDFCGFRCVRRSGSDG